MNHPHNQVATFDTGRPKSAWALGFGGALGAVSILVAYVVIRDRWIIQTQPIDYPAVFGGIMIFGFSLILSYIVLQSFQRTNLVITPDSLTWRTSGPLGTSTGSVGASESRRFIISGSDIMFHVQLELTSGKTLPLVSSVSARRWNECTAALRVFLPADPALQPAS